MELTAQQKERLKSYIEKYKVRLKAELSGPWKKERKERIVLFRRLLGKGKIDTLTEKDVAEIIKSLWASRLWTNKDYLVSKVLNSNGLPRLKGEFKELLYGSEPIETRFDNFLSRIKGLGPSSVTEILVFVYPDKYCLWNDKPKNVLPFLGLKDLLPDKVYKYAINGKDYTKCNKALGLVKKELTKCGFKNIDFLDLDIFMWLLFIEEVRKQPKLPITRAEKQKLSIDPAKLSHWDVMGILLELGNLLGYDTYVADPSKRSGVLNQTLGKIAVLKEIPPFTYQRHVDTVKNVDVIWFREEFPAYCFEVEATTGVTLGLLRLYQIRNFTNARFFVVAPANIISKFQTEITKDPFYKIKDRYRFKLYDDLVSFFDKAKIYHRIKETFLGEERK